MQLDLALKADMTAIDPVSIDRQPSFTRAIVLCADIGGLSPKELAGPIVRDEESWSRIKSPTPKQFFPQDKLLSLMDLAQNEAPLIWLARRRGYELVPMETELERKLRLKDEENELLRMENRVLKEAISGRR